MRGWSVELTVEVGVVLDEVGDVSLVVELTVVEDDVGVVDVDLLSWKRARKN